MEYCPAFSSVSARLSERRQPAEYAIYEVVQRWIAPDGRTTTVARLRGMSVFYYDQWVEYSDMEIRKNGDDREILVLAENALSGA